MREAIAILIAAATLGSAGLVYVSLPPVPVQLVAETWAGEAFVLGEGDTCPEAWLGHGPIPADWRVLLCRPAE